MTDQIAKTEEFQLTDDELATVGRFVRLLQNPGVQAAVLLGVAGDARNGQLMSEVFEPAIDDVIYSWTGHSPDLSMSARVVRMAPSAMLLLADLGSAGVIPADMLPDIKMMRRCLDEFYETFRRETAEANS